MIRRIAAFLLALLFFSALALPAIATPADNGDTIVYVTTTGTKYHRKSCGYLNRSCYEITLREAVKSGYSPCSRCSPPRYNGTIENSSRSSDRSQSSGSRSSSTGSVTSSAPKTVKKSNSFPIGIVIMLSVFIGIPGGFYLLTIISEKISDFKKRKRGPKKKPQEKQKQIAVPEARKQIAVPEAQKQKQNDQKKIKKSPFEQLIGLVVLIPGVTLGLLLLSRGSIFGLLLAAGVGYLTVKLVYFS